METSSQKLCLKWNNFQHNFMSEFEALKEDEDFVDVTLYCYGQCIKAHKIVLSACSPYLKHIFKEHPSKHPIIILDNLSFNNLEAVIQFMYTGQVYIEQNELPAFLKAAKTLQIRGLTESASSQHLFDTDLSSVECVSDSSILLNKREGDMDCEIKKAKHKKVRRISNNGTRDNNELFDEGKNKDCCEIITVSEGREEKSNENTVIEEQAYEEGKIFSPSNGDEDYTAGDLKRPHWLDPRFCPLCNRVYSNLSNLRQHMKLIHNPTLVTCKLCFKTFKTDLYLRRHLISFHDLNISGNGNSFSIESQKPVQNQTPEWSADVKAEPDSFQEMFNSTEIYQIPQ